MASPLDYVTERMRKHLLDRRASLQLRMAKGVPQEEYLRLCGAHAEVELLTNELQAGVAKVYAMSDETEFEDSMT